MEGISRLESGRTPYPCCKYPESSRLRSENWPHLCASRFLRRPCLEKGEVTRLRILPGPCEENCCLRSTFRAFRMSSPSLGQQAGGERNKVYVIYLACQPVTISSLIFLQLRELKWGPSFDQPQHGPTFRDGPKGLLTLAAEHRSEHNRQHSAHQLPS